MEKNIAEKYLTKEEINTSHLRCWIEINLSNIKHNIEIARKILPKGCELMCVIKANAYWFGDIEIGNYLQSLGVNNFAVATLQEAVRLREVGKLKGEILILGWTSVSLNEKKY